MIFATFMKILALLGRSNLPLHEYAFLFTIGPLLKELWSFKDTLLAENLFPTAGNAQNSLPLGTSAPIRTGAHGKVVQRGYLGFV